MAGWGAEIDFTRAYADLGWYDGQLRYALVARDPATSPAVRVRVAVELGIGNPGLACDVLAEPTEDESLDAAVAEHRSAMDDAETTLRRDRRRAPLAESPVVRRRG